MTLIGILLALALERGLGHLPGWGRPVIFLAAMRSLRQLCPEILWRSALMPLLCIVVPAWLVGWACVQIVNPLAALVASATVLLLCLGPRDLAEDVHDLLSARASGDLARVQQITRNLQRGPQPDESHRSLMGTLFIQSHEKLFGVLLWFFIFGPAGAVAYRVASRLPRLLAETAPDTTAQHAADAFHAVLAWLPVRFTAALFGLAGSLDDAIRQYRQLLREPTHGWRSQTWALLAEIATASLRVEDAAGAVVPPNLEAAMQEVLRMQTRALLVLLALFAIFATGGMF